MRLLARNGITAGAGYWPMSCLSRPGHEAAAGNPQTARGAYKTVAKSRCGYVPL